MGEGGQIIVPLVINSAVEDKTNGILSKSKKATPVQASGPEDSRRLRLPEAQEDGKIVSPTHRPPLLPRKYSWYSFVKG